MSSWGNNACSHLDLSALADKKPLAVAWYWEKSGWKLDSQAAKVWFLILAMWAANARRQFLMMANRGENGRGCLRAWLLTYVSEAAPSVWAQQMPHFYISKALSKCLFLFLLPKEGQFLTLAPSRGSDIAEDGRVLEESSFSVLPLLLAMAYHAWGCDGVLKPVKETRLCESGVCENVSAIYWFMTNRGSFFPSAVLLSLRMEKHASEQTTTLACALATFTVSTHWGSQITTFKRCLYSLKKNTVSLAAEGHV